jgi:hypothetical protein
VTDVTRLSHGLATVDSPTDVRIIYRPASLLHDTIVASRPMRG